MTPRTPVAVLQECWRLGLTLEAHGNQLHVIPGNRCPPDLAGTIREWKWHLLVMLKQPFVTVYSKAFEETIFSCEDEDTKAMLVEAGADPLSIYTCAELEVLVKANRIAPLTIAELTKLNEIKRTFNATIADEI
jgi:hypothetical protein